MNSNVNLPSLIIVDDDPLIRDALCIFLSDEFDVHLAENRTQAINLLRKMSALPQLPLLGIVGQSLPNSRMETLQKHKTNNTTGEAH